MKGIKGEKVMNEVDLYQTFVEAEKFYYDKFWLGVIGIALTLFFLLVMLLYANKKGSSTNSVGESNLTPN